ncbi:PREDICTED: monocarboxylate transporter 4-like [Priapulus caudatus]|uniref:Monocarboxylate transporter 4-like n=1 Tax=Priapulus caudatus TaxID=37621 RepID=A0ABM1ESJ7_PRICU|nr:PREDICTED: monocarboxylate transporter 4-like [Priapulus caudatus]
MIDKAPVYTDDDDHDDDAGDYATWRARSSRRFHTKRSLYTANQNHILGQGSGSGAQVLNSLFYLFNTLLIISHTGPIASALLNKLGARLTVIIGGLLASGGLISGYFAQSVYHIIISFGLVAGIGFGMVFTPCMVMAGTYFNRWRYLSTAVACSGAGFGTLAFSFIYSNLTEAYGWRGSMLINGGIALHLVLCGVILRPLSNAPAAKMPACDVTLLRDVDVLIFAVSMLLWSIGAVTVYVIVSDYLIESGIEEAKAYFLITIIGIAASIGSLLAGFTAFIRHIPYVNLWVYTLSVAGHGISSMLFSTGGTFGVFALYGTLFGFFYGMQLGALANVVIEFFGIQKFNSYGYFLFAEGIGNLIGAPIAGAIRDYTKSYVISFLFAGSSSLLSSAILVLLYILDKRKKPAPTDVDGKQRNSSVDHQRAEEQYRPRTMSTLTAETEVADAPNI